MKKGVIIQASSRSNGHTALIVKELVAHTGFDVVDLKTKEIGHFDYEFKNQEDDFNAVFKAIVENYNTVVFATPVYWYSMSGMLKVFLDRISDFLFQEKEYGRLLKGKNMALVSCNCDEEYFEGFETPIVKSANYLGMNFMGYLHTWVIEDNLTNEIKHKCEWFAKQKLLQQN